MTLMALKICQTCGEKVPPTMEKCPKCGAIPRPSASPVLIGMAIAGILLLTAVAGLFFL